MILLGLDTSTPVASVALAVGDRLYERAEKVTTYSERLLPLVDALFVEAGIEPSALDGVACGAGPGSFTGLRIGLATAKGLCLGTGAPLVLVSSLEVLAALAPAGATVLAAIDAFRGELYAGRFALDAQRTPIACSAAEAAFSTEPIALASVSAQLFVGDGFVKYPAAIPAGAAPLLDEGGATPSAPRARELLRLARARLALGRTDDPRHAAPLYVRASAPEEARR